MSTPGQNHCMGKGILLSLSYSKLCPIAESQASSSSASESQVPFLCGNQWVQWWLDPNTLHLQGVDTLRCCGWGPFHGGFLLIGSHYQVNPLFTTRHRLPGTSWCLGPKHHRLDAMPLRCCSHRHFLLKQGSGAGACLFLPNALSRNFSCIGSLWCKETGGQSHADVPKSYESTPALLACQLLARVAIG